jgi:hypothetical protein
LIRALLIEAVFIVKGDLVACLLIAEIGEKPALRRFAEHSVRKIRPNSDEPQGGECVGGIFHSAQDRQPHFGDRRVSEFVKQHEQHVTRYEFCKPLKVFRR